MTNEHQQNMAAICQDIIDDIEKDAAKLDGRPFDGRTVGTQFGEILATMQALAHICKSIIEDMPTEATIDITPLDAASTGS